MVIPVWPNQQECAKLCKMKGKPALQGIQSQDQLAPGPSYRSSCRAAAPPSSRAQLLPELLQRLGLMPPSYWGWCCTPVSHQLQLSSSCWSFWSCTPPETGDDAPSSWGWCCTPVSYQPQLLPANNTEAKNSRY